MIAAVVRCNAPFSEQGRAWPRGEIYDGELHVEGYSLEGAGSSSRVPLASLFKNIPVAALKANYAGTAKPASKKIQQFA